MAHRTIQLSASTTVVTRFTLAVLVATAAFLVFARESSSCINPPVRSPTEALQMADVVFAGKVVAADSVPGGWIYEFKVHTVWKGPLYEKVLLFLSVTADVEGSTCSKGARRLFSAGLEYLVYDNISYYNRTELLRWAKEDLAELGEGQRPVPGSVAPVPDDVKGARDLKLAIQIVIGIVIAIAITATGGLLMHIRAVRRRTANP